MAAPRPTAFRNAAELAMRDFPSAGIQIAVYDTQGHAGRRAGGGRHGACRRAPRSFSARSSPARCRRSRRRRARPACRSSPSPPMRASPAPGVYLLSFLPSDDVDRIVSYSASQGRKSFAALLPANAYGAVVEAAFRRAVAAVGRAHRRDRDATRRTTPTSRPRRRRSRAIAPQIDALLVPDAGDAVPAIARGARRPAASRATRCGSSAPASGTTRAS